MKRTLFCLLYLGLLSVCAFAEDDKKPAPPAAAPVFTAPVKTTHSLFLNGKELRYEAQVGGLELKDDEANVQGSMCYTAYFKLADEPQTQNRPITFCFNGGPGSSSVWLHIGLLGPKRVILKELGTTAPPSGYEDNPYTLLEATDLVFIDPIATGFSKAASASEEKQFLGVQNDIDSFAEFIRLFLTTFNRWDSPRFLLGESYGTIRAVGLANTLHDMYFIDVNGIVLISSCLDFQAYDEARGNSLGYVLTFPSQAATAWYYKKVSPEHQQKPLEQFLKEAQEFALGEYATALLLGSRLDEAKQAPLCKKIADMLGLSPEYVKASSLRIPTSQFLKELLRKDSKIIGRFDSRYSGFDHNAIESVATRDPCFDAVVGPFTSAFQQYLQKELHVDRTAPYIILNHNSSYGWNFSYNQTAVGFGYLQTSSKLVSLLEKNPDLGVFVASGYYDMATPFFATAHVLATLPIAPSLLSNIKTSCYEAGHMMYIHEPIQAKMRDELSAFIKEKTVVYNTYTGA